VWPYLQVSCLRSKWDDILHAKKEPIQENLSFTSRCVIIRMMMMMMMMMMAYAYYDYFNVTFLVGLRYLKEWMVNTLYG
jgi:hypothetical protein